MRHELARPRDRPRLQLREEAQPRRHVQQPGRFHDITANLHQICDGLEGQERDPDGQEDLQHRHRRLDPERPQRIEQGLHEEPVVLEPRELAQQDHHAHTQPHSTRSATGRTGDPATDRVGDHDHRGEQSEEAEVPPPVEDPPGGQQPQPPEGPVRRQRPGAHDDHDEELRERHGGEEHGRQPPGPSCTEPDSIVARVTRDPKGRPAHIGWASPRPPLLDHGMGSPTWSEAVRISSGI